jgi:hypothetical protein
MDITQAQHQFGEYMEFSQNSPVSSLHGHVGFPRSPDPKEPIGPPSINLLVLSTRTIWFSLMRQGEALLLLAKLQEQRKMEVLSNLYCWNDPRNPRNCEYPGISKKLLDE